MSGEITVVVPINNMEFISNVYDNIARQTLAPIETIVVINGSFNWTSTNYNEFTANVPLRFIFLEVESASVARNVGIENSKSEFIALMDCDDYWFPEKLEKQRNMIEKLDKPSIVCCRSIRKSGLNLNIKPKTVFGNSKLCESLYKFSYLSNEVYLPTPTWLFRRDDLRTIQFDKLLDNREDLKFLLDAEKSGLEIIQIEEPLVWINHELERSLKRENLLSYLKWTSILLKVSPRQATAFALGIGLRNLIFNLASSAFRGTISLLKGFKI